MLVGKGVRRCFGGLLTLFATQIDGASGLFAHSDLGVFHRRVTRGAVEA